MKKQILSILLICCIMFGLFPISAFAEAKTMQFTDVETTDWFYDEVCYAYLRGFMRGTSETTFEPNSVASRGMIITILYRLNGEPSVVSPSVFTDVTPGSWYENAVIWAYDNGIIEGYGDGEFKPDETLTREQLATIMYRYASYKKYDVSAASDLSGFVDNDKISSYAVDSLKWSAAIGLIKGVGDSMLDPTGEATRAQLAVIFYRFCNIFETYTVDFDMQGHGEQVTPIVGVLCGTAITEPTPAPTAEGYTFGGWFKESACENEWIFESDTVTAPTTLYAKWVVTIANVLPDGFPSAEESSTEPPASAWGYLLSDTQCYLSYDGLKLFFYNELGDPNKQFGVDTDKILSKTDDNTYVYTENTVTITFSLSEGVLTSITFADTNSDVWDGTYQESACIAAGTMITMEHGEQKAVEDLELGDVIRTFNHETGEVSFAPVCFIWKSKNAANAFALTFEDGTAVTVIEEHGFYDKEEKGYAFINMKNAADYIGHHFYNADTDSWLELKSFEVFDGGIDAYAVATSGHINHLSNGMLSICDGTFKIIANLFEYDDNMMFDAEKKKADIEAYGLTPIEKVLEFEGFYEVDYYDYNLQYLNIAVGKGFITWELMKELSDYCLDNGL